MKYFNIKTSILSLLFIVLSLSVFSQCRFAGLADDLADSNHGTKLKEFIDANPGGSDAYFLMFDAFGQTRAFTKDVPTLTKVMNLMEDAAFTERLGANWIEELGVILEKNRILHCAAAGDATGKSRYFSSMPEFLEEVSYFVKNFDVTAEGPNKFYRWLKRSNIDDTAMLNENLPIIDEMYQTLYVLKKRGFTSQDIVNFGERFAIGIKEFDLLSNTGKFIELKNVNFATSALKNKTQVISQLIQGYFKNINSLDDFEWVVHLKKLKAHGWNDTSTALTNMKNQMKEMLIAKADDIFKPIDDGGLGIDRIKQLFGDDIDTVDDFIDILDDFDSPESIYRFIKVE